ncbi:hypothetical protein KDA_29180 [Dictyobacter alpinus]|uniref:Response regulatory domain-containing protein n=1 Tax=Dictyobacter alpinus TaxID=2014873 RepID=A0A402B7U9_9CHLR|nr:response regulator [Dictyobacter alpinus]GCE27434.1 hypothetical protein KDA_29180 [Dictyobacter alpinus]
MVTTSKVLIIDDSATQCLFMRQALQNSGYQVVVANDGKQGLRMIAQENPQCLILDVILPGMNGFELCRYIRSQEAWRALPVLMVSSKSASSDRFWAMRQGANAYLTKPFKANELVQAVSEIITESPRLPNTSIRPPANGTTGSQRPIDPHTPPPVTGQTTGPYRPVDLQPPFAPIGSAAGQQPANTIFSTQEKQAGYNQRDQGTPLTSNARGSQFVFPPQAPKSSGSVRETDPSTPIGSNPMFALRLFIPRRIEYVEPHPIADLRARHLYQFIDGQRNVELLKVLSKMTREELVNALRLLVQQQHVHLYEPGGRLMDSSI